MLSFAFFALSVHAQNSDPLISIRLTITPEAIDALSRNPRGGVPVVVQMHGKRITNCTAHLKGTGSFKPISEKPSFSIRSPTTNLLGRKKLLLNNSSQDRSFVKWKIASELFAKAGVPSPEVGFARVTLNEKRLGLYLILEPTDKVFLKKHFSSVNGNLYEGANKDITDVLDQDNGRTGERQRDRESLAAACLERNLRQRWTKLNQVLDLERFASFMAMEVLVDHRDGYSMDRNNFRLYHDPQIDRFVFLPHGLDLLFNTPELSPSRQFSSVLASSLLETKEGKALYEDRLKDLALRLFSDESVIKRIDELWALIKNEAPADSVGSVKEVKTVLRERIKLVRSLAR